MIDETAPGFFESNYCGVEQLEARKAHNLEVAGSSPAPANMGPTVFEERITGGGVVKTKIKKG